MTRAVRVRDGSGRGPVIRPSEHTESPYYGLLDGRAYRRSARHEKPERFLTLILGGAPGRFEWSVDDQRRTDIEAAELDDGLVTSQIMRLWPKNQPKPSDDEVRAMSAKRLEGMDPKALPRSAGQTQTRW